MRRASDDNRASSRFKGRRRNYRYSKLTGTTSPREGAGMTKPGKGLNTHSFSSGRIKRSPTESGDATQRPDAGLLARQRVCPIQTHEHEHRINGGEDDE